MNKTQTPTLIPTPELLGSLVTLFKDSAVVEFKSTPNAFLKKIGFEINAEIKLINNESDIVNLALPFYSDIERTAGAMLSDDDLEAVSGGAAIQVLDNYVLSGVRDILAEGPLTRERLDEALQEYSNATGGGSPFSW